MEHTATSFHLLYCSSVCVSLRLFSAVLPITLKWFKSALDQSFFFFLLCCASYKLFVSTAPNSDAEVAEGTESSRCTFLWSVLPWLKYELFLCLGNPCKPYIGVSFTEAFPIEVKPKLKHGLLLIDVSSQLFFRYCYCGAILWIMMAQLLSWHTTVSSNKQE